MSAAALVLMYHAVVAEASGLAAMDPQDAAYALTREDFDRHLEMLQASDDLRVIPPDALFASPSEPEAEDSARPVCITFDDSLPQHAEVALPVLAARNWTAVAFVSTGELDTPGRLRSEQARELSQSGWCLGLHGREHAFLTSLPDPALADALQQGMEELMALGEGARPWLSLPGGRGDDRVLRAARAAGFMRVFASTPGLWTQDSGAKVARCVIRGGPAGTETLRTLIADPAGTTAQLAVAARRRDRLRGLFGDRLYHWLHGLWFRLNGGAGSGDAHA